MLGAAYTLACSLFLSHIAFYLAHFRHKIANHRIFLDSVVSKLAAELTEWRQRERQMKANQSRPSTPSAQLLWQRMLSYHKKIVQGHVELADCWRDMSVSWRQEVNRSGERGHVTEQNIRDGLIYGAQTLLTQPHREARLQEIQQQYLQYLATQGLATPPATSDRSLPSVENSQKREAKSFPTSDRPSKRLCPDTRLSIPSSMPKGMLRNISANRKVKRRARDATGDIHAASSAVFSTVIEPFTSSSNEEAMEVDDPPITPAPPLQVAAQEPLPQTKVQECVCHETGNASPEQIPAPVSVLIKVLIPNAKKARLQQRREKKKTKENTCSGSSVRVSKRYNFRPSPKRV